MRGIVVVVIGLTGCIKTTAVTCGDGHVCSPDRICDDVRETCVFPDQLTSCIDMPDGTPCSINRVPGGICKDMVCIPATCGDELVANGEVCDGETDIPAVGTCVDFAYDYGPLSCSTLCTEGFESCRRFGWQLRSVTGVGAIAAIWEDGADLWVANQNGILHRHAGVWEPLIKPTTMTVQYKSIWASGGHAFAAGFDGAVAHFDGATWESRDVNGGAPLFGIWGRSPTDVFAVGGATKGVIFHFDGSAWSPMSMATSPPPLHAVWGAGTQVYAVGDSGTVLQLDGQLWSPMISNTGHDLRSVWGSSGTAVFAVGNPSPTQIGSEATIIQLDGVWQPMPIPPDTFELNGISGRSAAEIYAVGARDGSNILYYDGEAWTPMVSSVTTPILRLHTVHAGDGVYAAARPSLFIEYAGAGRLETPSPSDGVRGIWSTRNYAIAVGDGLAFQEYDQGSWKPVNYPACWGATTFVHAVWGTRRDDLWIVGPYGKMMHKGPSTVTCVNAPQAKWINDIWGFAPNDIFAVGSEGMFAEANLLHYDGTTWSDWSAQVIPLTTILSGVWGSGPTDVYAVGSTKVVHYDGATWRDAGLVTTHVLKAVWGSGPTDVFAVGSEGAIFHFDGTAWTQMVVPLAITTPTDLEWKDVHGTGPNDVYVVGSRTLLHYDGTSWAPMSRLVASSVDAVWATSGTVIAGGEGGMDARVVGRLQ